MECVSALEYRAVLKAVQIFLSYLYANFYSRGTAEHFCTLGNGGSTQSSGLLTVAMVLG